MRVPDNYDMWREHEWRQQEKENPCEYCVSRDCITCGNNEDWWNENESLYEDRRFW